MSTRTSSIRIEYKPLSTSDSVTTLSGNQRQTYDVNTGYFHPDRRLDPLTLQVTCSVSDPHNFVNGVINNDLTDIVWKITDTTGKLVTIQSTDKQFKIGTGVDKGKITIYKNIPDLDETTLEFTAKYIDPKTKRVVNFQKTFSIITVTEAVAQNQLQLTTPVGTVQFPFVNDKGLVLQADLIREGKKVPAAYWWKKDGKDLTDASDKIVVLDTVKNGNVYQVEVADCTKDLYEIIKPTVDNDPLVLKGNKAILEQGTDSENLISNKLLNYIQFINGKVSDSDFYTYSIKGNVASAYSANRFGNGVSGYRVFVDKTVVPFENNKQYTLFIEYKILSKTGGINNSNEHVGVFCFEYIDGSRSNLSIELTGVINDFNKKSITSEKGKTVKNISFSYWYSGDICANIKLDKTTNKDDWMPAVDDVDQLVKEKTDYYASQTTLPPGYRPNPKPTNLLKKEVLLKRSLGSYEVDILYPKVVDPDVTEVQFEAVFTNNRGIIANSSKWFDVGWWKKADGTYEYTGLKIKVPIAKLQSIITSGKGVEYTVIEK